MTTMDGVLGLPLSLWAGLFASAAIFLGYAFAARSFDEDPIRGWRWSPLTITAGVFGRASLSNLQLLFFSLVVFWVVLYVLYKDAQLTNLSEHVLYLLGIGAIGSGAAKVVAVSRKRLSFENWAWLKRKKWIKEDIGRQRRPPVWSDLVKSDGAFDIFKFQSVVVSAIVGFGILIVGVVSRDPNGLANFKIPEGLLGLLGLSQVTYIGGKVAAPAPVEELNKQLNEVRDLEGKFREAVAKAWAATSPPVRDLATAILAAPDAYAAFRDKANNALEMVTERIGGRHTAAEVNPDIPT